MKRDDNAVAEIIGTVLIFVIVVTLLTAYASWYVPLQEQRSQQEFYQNSIAAENALSAKVMEGYSFVQNFPAGISGGFGNTFDTYLSFINETYGSFSASFSVLLNSSGKNVYENYSVNYVQSGYISAYPSASFLESLYINDYGNFITDGSTFYGPMFIRMSNDTFCVSLAHLVGKNFSESSSSSVYIAGSVLERSLTAISINQTIYVNGTPATVKSITMTVMNYGLAGSFTGSFEKYLLVSNDRLPSTGNYTLGNYSLILDADHFTLSLTKPISISTLDISYFSYYIST
ncbi:hypothetical protein [Thermoplasma sp.]|uniref:hypothetical protein n=1 Tax=Thermoplasma sp. TaxID=1973142 RepID=UPI0026299005|nr:hypothetical protein [Thermoplasma sp.]